MGDKGLTALHHAASTGEAATVGLLLECDASPDRGDHNGNTPLHMCAIANKRLPTSALMWGGADITAQNAKGNTVLHECALSGAKDVAFLIIENGAVDLRQIKNKDGQTPVELARMSGHTKCAETIETGQH